MTTKLTRRQILAGGTAAATLGLTAGARGDESGLTGETLKACERLLGVDYTPAEREQMLPTLDDYLDRLRAIRALKQPNDLAPALTFDPRLPGKIYSAKSDRVRHPKAKTKFPVREEDIAFASLSELGRWLRKGEISSLELTDLYLKRIAAYAPKLECFVTVTGDLAREQARDADRDFAKGVDRGPLHGIPFGLKDLTDTKGIKTTWGAMPYKDRVPGEDATIVERLSAAGAVMLGKTTLGAIAYGDIWFGGKTRNPWNALEGSSGSSAGSASATAAGLCAFAIGTETLGSIISPSNRCGATGLRPTFGRVPRTGAMALCWSLDKIGSIGRSVADTLLVLEVLNGPDGKDPAAIEAGFPNDRSRPTIGFDPKWFEGEDATPLDMAALETLKSLRYPIREITIPDHDYSPLLTILEAEAAAAFEELTEDNLDDLMVWQDAEAWPNTWRRARLISAIDMINADRFRRTLMREMGQIFEQVDLLAGPNFAGSMLVITNYTGHPQLTFRAGFMESPVRGLAEGETDPEKLFRVPQNFSLWGPLFSEARMASAGEELEKALGVASERPRLF